MTHIASVRSLALIVAFHALRHGSRFLEDDHVAFRHRPMASGALNLSLPMMHLM
jgi:hypothetical protein